MIGKTLSHYRITEKLGEGGMGVVYKAHDTHLDRLVALKVLPPEKVADPDRKRRFIQEAKAASALNHPNIVTIYDIDQCDGIDFIAMEYVAGKTLDALIPRKGMRLSLAVKYGIQLADALARAHGAGIIHRDLKPSNVMVDEHGLVKVLDFGPAKLTETAGSEEETAAKRTGAGTILGTAACMSPEQAEGKHIDRRSDNFSFGSMLYEMLTGQRVFRGDTRASTIASILREDPKPISQVAEGLPPEVVLYEMPGGRRPFNGPTAAVVQSILHEDPAPLAGVPGRRRRGTGEGAGQGPGRALPRDGRVAGGAARAGPGATKRVSKKLRVRLGGYPGGKEAWSVDYVDEIGMYAGPSSDAGPTCSATRFSPGRHVWTGVQTSLKERKGGTELNVR